MAAAFVDERSLERMDRFAVSVPAGAFEHLGFERRLDAPGAGTDLALSLSTFGLTWIETDCPWSDITLLARTWEVERRARRWNVWLESDTSTETDFTRAPNILLDFDRREAAALSTVR
ncbi:MAG TPA: hypothetical protein VKG44_07900, partial [Candidatus Baltobacteraceae bacterium]|nr:hypothetical protein [Candidatus Baltobacteraceae bacterium]